ncbi:MAG: protoheme IX farnesyltransferase [Verrucomicrobia bacterium]|jgi:protoheme IX farnesyltransferase|nr:MAG: protoheme IX farnesyltransferase [Verrucomicrobiota bacterium]
MSERAGSVPAAYWELTKPRLSFLSVLTSLAGYFCSAPAQPTDAKVLVSLALGTALAAGGCGAVNMWWESDADAKMERTRNRPIPAGIVRPGAALLFGMALLTAGVTLVWLGANPLAGALTAATAFSYLFLYTPLKTLTSWCTLVGSLPGAIPPIIGTAAKIGDIDRMGWLLFALLFFWQVPHFMALAVMCREDYARGGFKVATVDDPSGRSASIWAMAFILPMIFVAGAIATNFFPNWTSPYVWVSFLAGAWFFKLTLEFALPQRRAAVAKPLFIASILYLPVVLLTLTLNRLF